MKALKYKWNKPLNMKDTFHTFTHTKQTTIFKELLILKTPLETLQEILITDLTPTPTLMGREQIYSWILISLPKFEYLAILHFDIHFFLKILFIYF